MAKPRSAANILQKGNKKANQLSPAMFAWAKANKSKLKSPTKAQKKIFAQYDAMVKAGDTPANPKPRPTPSKPKNSEKLKTKTKPDITHSFYDASSKGRYGPNRDKTLF